jgi:hypothetical protein
MPIGGSSSTFSGSNIFNGLTTINGGIALPSNGTVTTISQLGYTYTLQCATITPSVNGYYNAATLNANTLAVGTYLVSIKYPLTVTAGTHSVFMMEIGTTSAMFSATGNNSTTKTKTIVCPNRNGTASTYFASGNFSTILLVPNATQVFYLVVYIQFTGSITFSNGSAFFTRIA